MGMQIVLDNGTKVRIRPIRPSDKPLLEAALGRLSDETIHRRFLAPKPRFTGTDLRYLTEVDGRDHYALVGVLADRPDVLVGVGRWIRDPVRTDRAEVAIVIGDEFQGHGLGTALGLALADAARARGVRSFTATMLAENAPAQRLFAVISHRLRVTHEGATDAVVGDLAA